MSRIKTIDFWFSAYPDSTCVVFRNSVLNAVNIERDQFRSYALISTIFLGSWPFSLSLSLWELFVRTFLCVALFGSVCIIIRSEFEITWWYILRYNKTVKAFFAVISINKLNHFDQPVKIFRCQFRFQDIFRNLIQIKCLECQFHFKSQMQSPFRMGFHFDFKAGYDIVIFENMFFPLSPQVLKNVWLPG